MSDNTAYSRKLNKHKNLIQIGDIAISEKYGVGTVEKIEQDDVLNPILIQFEPDRRLSHHHIGYNNWYDCNGESQSPSNSVKFYRQIDLKNKEQI